jgi:hypothetical protein
VSQQPGSSESLERQIEGIVSIVLTQMTRRGFAPDDDPTLAPEFRCPHDGSSRTAKIRALLDSRPRGTFRWDGKTITFIGGDERLSRLDPGPKPSDLTVVYYLGLGTALVGSLILGLASTLKSPVGWVIIGLGFWISVVSRFRDRDLESRLADWRKKTAKADTHWLCDPCGEDFLPEANDHGDGIQTPPLPENVQSFQGPS